MEEKGIKDDTEMFTIFALFDKLEKHPDKLTPIERLALEGFGIEI
jgi:hypothetical protein